MGWTVSPTEKRPADMTAWLRRHYDLTRPGGYRQTVLDTGRAGSTYFVALEVVGDDKAPDGGSYVTCVVVETQGSPNRPGWGWKSCDEMMGPREDRCPEHILRRLSRVECLPYAGGYAQGFRDRCQARLQGKAASRAA